jgi:hypothetical protein
MWNALATRLWTRTVQLVNRAVASQLNISQRQWPDHGRVSVAKVAEYQARGLVHFHAIFRIDGHEQTDDLPAGANADILCQAIRDAACTARVIPPECPTEGGLELMKWGEQLDLRPIISTEILDQTSLSDGQVAGYIAKYATKGADASGTVNRPIACRSCSGLGHETDTQRRCGQCKGTGGRHVLDHLHMSRHARAMIETCWRLGGHTELEELRLRPWAHMLGFRGHFSTKTRRYSTTLGCLRQARQTWRHQRTLDTHNIDAAIPVRRFNVKDLERFESGDDMILVVGNWQYMGRGHSTGEAIFASTVRGDMAETRRIWRQVRHAEWEGAA